jgi:hypothetical protein
MAEYAWRPLGELLIARGLIDEYELEAALTEQRLTGQLLGELLVAKRKVSPIEMAAALAAHHGVHLDTSDPARSGSPVRVVGNEKQRAWRPLGRILVGRDMLTESGLQRCLLTQQRKGGSLGEILLERGYVTPAQLADALTEQHGLEVHPEVIEEAKPLRAEEDPCEHYEVRTPGDDDAAPIFVSQSYLDATDFAFELLGADDPDALEIVRVAGEAREQVWTYSREASDAFRTESEDRYRTFQPLVQRDGGTAPIVIRLRSETDT